MSSPRGSGQRGYLVPIGGGVSERRGTRILERFVQLCGGSQARLAIIPSASQASDTGAQIEQTFCDLGARGVHVLPYRSRTECCRKDWLQVLDTVDGVFLTGGSQLRLARTIGGTAVARTIRSRYRQGLHVAGTSAGASYLSEHMIAFGNTGAIPRSHMVTLAPGLGLSQQLVIDQHFRQRNRLGRLLSALAYSPSAMGLGLDEATAAFIAPGGRLEIVGDGSATIADGTELEFASVARRRGDPVCLIGVRLHVLPEGSTYDLRTRQATPPDDVAPAETATRAAEDRDV